MLWGKGKGNLVQQDSKYLLRIVLLKGCDGKIELQCSFFTLGNRRHHQDWENTVEMVIAGASAGVSMQNYACFPWHPRQGWYRTPQESGASHPLPPHMHLHRLTLIKSPVAMQELPKDEPVHSSVLFPLPRAALTESPSHLSDRVTATPLLTNLAFSPL